MAIAMKCLAMLKTAVDFSISLDAVLRLWPQSVNALRPGFRGGALEYKLRGFFAVNQSR